MRFLLSREWSERRLAVADQSLQDAAVGDAGMVSQGEVLESFAPPMKSTERIAHEPDGTGRGGYWAGE
jgi:hypothetical protein